MAIRKAVPCFRNGSIVKLDLDEKGRPVSETPAPTGDKEPTKLEFMAQLKEKGIKFKATMGAKELKALLDETPAPTSETGTGNQDVI